MANIYVDNDTKVNLDKLIERECRSISDEIKFLIDNRLAELEKVK